MIILLYIIQARGGGKKRAIKRIRVYYINKWGEKINIYYWYKAKERDIYTRVFLLVTTLL